MIKRMYVLYILALSGLIPAQLSAADFLTNHPTILLLGTLAAGGLAGGTAVHVAENTGVSMADNLQERAQNLLGGESIGQVGNELISHTSKEIADNILPATETGINKILDNAGKQSSALLRTTGLELRSTLMSANKETSELLQNTNIELKSILTLANSETQTLLTHTKNEIESLLIHTSDEAKSLLTHTNQEVMPLLTHVNGEAQSLLTHTAGEVKSLLSHTNTEIQSLSTHLNSELKSTFAEGIEKLDTTSNNIIDRAKRESNSFAKSFILAGLCSAAAIMGLKFFYDGFQECFAEENTNKSKTKPIIKMSVGSACFAAALYGVYKQFE